MVSEDFAVIDFFYYCSGYLIEDLTSVKNLWCLIPVSFLFCTTVFHSLTFLLSDYSLLCMLRGDKYPKVVLTFICYSCTKYMKNFINHSCVYTIPIAFINSESYCLKNMACFVRNALHYKITEMNTTLI